MLRLAWMEPAHEPLPNHTPHARPKVSFVGQGEPAVLVGGAPDSPHRRRGLTQARPRSNWFALLTWFAAAIFVCVSGCVAAAIFVCVWLRTSAQPDSVFPDDIRRSPCLVTSLAVIRDVVFGGIFAVLKWKLDPVVEDALQAADRLMGGDGSEADGGGSVLQSKGDTGCCKGWFPVRGLCIVFMSMHPKPLCSLVKRNVVIVGVVDRGRLVCHGCLGAIQLCPQHPGVCVFVRVFVRCVSE